MFHRLTSALIGASTLTMALLAADIQSLPGHGKAVAEKKVFSQEKENQKAFDLAERNAVTDALRGALVKLLGREHPELGKVDALAQDLADHSSAFVRDTVIKDSRMDGLNATVSVLLKVDFAGLKEYLESKGVSLTQAFEAKFKFFVLSYSVEGMDPSRSKPIVLREEVRAESQNTQASDYSSSSSDGASYQAQRSAGAVVVSPYGGGAVMGAQASVDASRQSASQAAGSSYASGSASYFRVTEYADPTKRGMGGNSEARALIAGALQRADLTTATIEAPLVGQEFRQEDEFVNKVLQSVRRHPEVNPDDVVAIAINSLTALPASPTNHRGHQFSSRVTCYFVRIKDGINILPTDSVTKTSESLASDDEARTQAIALSVAALSSRLPQHVRTNLQKMQRMAGKAAAAPAGSYVITIQNVQDRSVLVKAKQWLRQQGFKFKSDASAGGTVETLTLELGDRSPEEIKDVLDGLPATLELVAKTDTEARVRVR